MKNLNWKSEELEWIERVRQLLIELARASLADIPRLPANLSQKALPLVEGGQDILDAASRQGLSEEARSQYPELQWVEQVRQFFLDLVKISLSEHPRLPEHLSRNALALAEKAQEIQEEAEAMDSSDGLPSKMATEDTTTSQAPVSESLDANSSPSVLLEALKKSVKTQQANSSGSEAPEWSQLVNLIELAQGLYQRVKE
ncbi:inorganic pyrophosphatase [Oscillatoriales cyanobacterium LEGE 11467]|uniref:Inorganic pyrophosphatase n=1 Tax=Zarconia navalis LEGE 11467 TaxID=1828826 RepID=A0A928VVU0_9CYAN|nr:inorganic pyrophosphatase [Zarconia navalis]MBE9041269.1 inorganic pyrophosphatase [Zarconia navalis LEGE 11467]